MASRVTARRALVVLAVLVAALCTHCAADNVTDTIAFLRGLQTVFPDYLAATSSNDTDYCNWEWATANSVVCQASTGLNILVRDGTVAASSQLPEVTGDDVVAASIVLDVASGGPLTLPASWSRLSQLVHLYLYNGFAGTLPAAWGRLPALRMLQLQGNALTGTLPAAWASLSSIMALRLYDNALSGTLPAAWASFSSPMILDLHNNQLTGSLPAEWSALRLVLFNVSGNHFCGCEPDSWKAVPVLHNAVKDMPVAWANCSTANSCTYPDVTPSNAAGSPAGCALAAVVAAAVLACLATA
ncbi:surface membrane protein gp46-like protein [Strigomonas culicis]|uniref:Surface membrane protein gp46-like protein n=1 Tax=Strigomonas culicis TaxID=28005 RepID=S9V5R2_9TRYP|nr:surface membrane protein gp46-like protein [Strigomonas culicis]|eukprot:EPY18235.1 surface membrane protein gp46-like protein [Strigomonas culicis]